MSESTVKPETILDVIVLFNEKLELNNKDFDDIFDVEENENEIVLKQKKFIKQPLWTDVLAVVKEWGGKFAVQPRRFIIPKPQKVEPKVIPIDEIMPPESNARAIKPWQKMLDLLPPLSSYEQEELLKSLKQYGIQESIIVWKNQMVIIDGNTRWELLNGKIPEGKIEYFEGTEEQAFSLGIQLNFARRQLSNEQKKALCKKFRQQGFSQQKVSEITGVPQPTLSRWESNIQMNNAFPDIRISIPKKEYGAIHERLKSGETQQQIAADFKVTKQRIGQIVKIVEARKTPQQAQTPSFPDKKFRCLVIDPPWPVQKIEREERPNQGSHLDYSTLTLEEIEKLPIPKLANPEGCHVFLWVTQKFLPEGLKLFEKWGVKYQCLLTWVKPTGMTPFSWMYNTEHVLFGRVGSLELLKYGLKLAFESPITKHSEKPEVFYGLVREVSPEPRSEMFQRKPHEGFEGWGAEAAQ